MLNRLLYWLTWIAAACLLVSYIAAYVSPRHFWPLAFFGLAYPVFLAGNILFFLYWLIFWEKAAIIPVLFIAVGFGQHKKLFACSERVETHINTSLHVMSYNVRLFDLYNWQNRQNLIIRDKIFEFIRSQNLDILCLQEFFHDRTGHFPTLEPLLELQQARNYHVEYTLEVDQKYFWGIATFSEYPVVGRGRVEMPIAKNSNNICIYTDVLFGKDTLRVYNMHLASLHLQYSDYQFLKFLGDANPGYKPYPWQLPKEKPGWWEGLISIAVRIKRASVQRAEQAETIARHIASSPHPVIVCGDFNDTPFSYTYRIIAQGLSDAFTRTGNGFGRTYIGAMLPVRIDFILHNRQLQSAAFKTYQDIRLSDHYPMSCRISATPPP